MTSMRELFAVPPKASKNFIALNVRNAYKKPSSSNSKTLPTVQSGILRETNGSNVRSTSKVLYYKTCPINVKHKPKAYRNAGCQTIDLENNESFLEDGVIRYPSSKWKERSTQDQQFKSIALQTETRLQQGQSEETELCRSDVNAVCATSASSKSDNEQVVVEKSNNGLLGIESVDLPTCSTTKGNQNAAPSMQKNKKEPKSTKKIIENRQNDFSTQLKVPAKFKRGTIPKYLIEKKLEKEREQKKILEEAERTGVLDPDCPPGHILLPTEKRLEQLEFLKKNYKNLINELNRIPVRNDSLKIRQRQVLMEKELDKLEEGIKLFSKEKLFVKP